MRGMEYKSEMDELHFTPAQKAEIAQRAAQATEAGTAGPSVGSMLNAQEEGKIVYTTGGILPEIIPLEEMEGISIGGVGYPVSK